MSLPRLGLIYAGIHLLISAAAFAVLFALEAFFAFSFDSNFLAVLIPMLAAMQVGQIWFNRTGTRPTNGFAWQAALLFALIAFGISMLLSAGIYAAGLVPQLRDMLADPQSRQIFAIVLAVLVVLLVLVCRLGFGMGARQAAKLKARLDAKSAK